MSMLGLLQNLISVASVPVQSVGIETVVKFAELAGVGVEKAHADMLISVIKKEADVGSTVGDWFKTPGNAQRALGMILGQDGSPEVCRCPICHNSFVR